MERKKKEISFRLAKEWYSSVMLIVYSLVMTLFFIVTHWETVLTGKVFFTRLVNVIRGIWEVAWPAVYGYWFEQFQADTGSLIATIITAVLCARVLLGLIVLFLKWKHGVDRTYEEKDKRKAETTVLIALASLVLSLIICSRADIGMTWIMLWILLTTGSSFLFQTIRLIWINKYRP